MEKNKPHYVLSQIKTLVREGHAHMTATARSTSAELGFTRAEVFAEIDRIFPGEFYKSMTTYRDHTVWQDVYHHQTDRGMVYIKLTVLDGVLVVSFKEL